MTADDGRLASLQRQIRTDPEAVAVESLVPRCGADGAMMSDFRNAYEELARTHPRPDVLVRSVLEGVLESEPADRRHLLVVLLSTIRTRPRPVARTLRDALESDRPAVRFAAVEVLAFTVGDCWGLYRPAIPALRRLLLDDDSRTRAAAAATLASLARPYPDEVSAAIPDAVGLIEEPSDSTGAFAFLEHQPAGRALELLAELARQRPDAVLSGIRPATTVLREDDRFVEPAVRYLSHVARECPDALEPMPWLPDRAENLTGESRVAVLDLARCVGGTDGTGSPVDRREPASRDGQVTEADRAYLESLDEEIQASPDVERLLSLLRATDVDVRRQAALALFEPRTAEDAAAIHAHAGEFLALLDEPDDGTRTTLESVLRPVVARYAPEWLPALIDIAKTGTPVERRFVGSLFSAAARTYPTGVRDHLETVLELADRTSETTASITTGWTLFHVATAHPDAIRPFNGTVLALGADSRGIAAKTIVELLRAYPDDADVFAPMIREACREVAAELDDAPTEEPLYLTTLSVDHDTSATPAGLCRVLKAVCLLATSNPAAVEPVRSALTTVAAHGPGEGHEQNRARMLATSALVELDRESREERD